MVSASGVGDFTAEQLRKVLGSKVVNIQPTINRFSTDINGSAAKGDVETMLQLTYLYFTRPNFDRGRLDMVIEANRKNLENSVNSPDFVMTQMVTNSEHEFLMNRSWQVLIVVKLALGIVICLLMRQVIILFILSGILTWKLSSLWWKNILEDFLPGSNNWDGRMTG